MRCDAPVSVRPGWTMARFATGPRWLADCRRRAALHGWGPAAPHRAAAPTDRRRCRAAGCGRTWIAARPAGTGGDPRIEGRHRDRRRYTPLPVALDPRKPPAYRVHPAARGRTILGT